jgi:hypothetical protein
VYTHVYTHVYLYTPEYHGCASPELCAICALAPPLRSEPQDDAGVASEDVPLAALRGAAQDSVQDVEEVAQGLRQDAHRQRLDDVRAYGRAATSVAEPVDRKVVRTLLARLSMSQGKLATEIGVSGTSVSIWFNHERYSETFMAKLHGWVERNLANGRLFELLGGARHGAGCASPELCAICALLRPARSSAAQYGAIPVEQAAPGNYTAVPVFDKRVTQLAADPVDAGCVRADSPPAERVRQNSYPCRNAALGCDVILKNKACEASHHTSCTFRKGDLKRTWTEARQVRKTPSWPRSWANFSLF